MVGYTMRWISQRLENEDVCKGNEENCFERT